MVSLRPILRGTNELTANQKRCACIPLCMFSDLNTYPVLNFIFPRRPFNIRESVNDSTWVSEDPSKPPVFHSRGNQVRLYITDTIAPLNYLFCSELRTLSS